MTWYLNSSGPLTGEHVHVSPESHRDVEPPSPQDVPGPSPRPAGFVSPPHWLCPFQNLTMRSVSLAKVSLLGVMNLRFIHVCCISSLFVFLGFKVKCT